MNRLQRLEVALVLDWLMLLVFSLSLAVEAAKAETTDWNNLQGSWRIISGSYYDSQAELSSTGRIVGNGFTFEEHGRVLSLGTFQLKPCQSPKAIDIEVTQGRVALKGRKSLGIYKLDGDILVLCWAQLGSTERPKDFIAHASHSRHQLLTFERVKP